MEKLAVTSNEVTISELQDIALMMQQHLGNESEQSSVEIEAALQRKGAFFGLFPTEIQKAHEALTIEKLHLLCRSRDKLFQIYTNIQIEIARKRGEALVAATNTDMQAKLASFVAVKIKEIQRTVNESRVSFMEEMKPQYANVEKYKHIPDLYDPACESIREQTQLYFEFMSKLLKGFNDAMDGKLAEYRR